MSKWFHLDSGKCDAALNMAIDDALLRSAVDNDKPLLRFYGWEQPAATFGYFQEIADLEDATQLRPLVRRPTGGGLVPHINDWTYSLVVPPLHKWHTLRAEESYRRMHEWICDAMGSLGVHCELADCCRKEVPGQCFAGYEKFDVLRHGRKIAGAAQRRNKLGLLIQGSIQPTPVGVERTQFIEAMISRGNVVFEGFSVDFDPRRVLESAQKLAASRYSLDSYNRRR